MMFSRGFGGMVVAVRLSTFVFALALFALAAVQPRQGAHAQDRPVCTGDLVCLDQGWTDNQRWWWYTTSQGSRLLPLGWMLALQSAASPSDRPEWLLSAGNLERWGYLPGSAPNQDGYRLPLGFVIDPDDRGAGADIMCDTFPESCKSGLMRRKWVGLTCAACHTNDVEYGGKRVRVEGAATLADFQTFEEDVLRALESTYDDSAKFARFARIVLKGRNSAVSRRQLRTQLAEHIAWQRKLETANRSRVRYGHGRLDAQGHILNKVEATIGLPLADRRIPAEAPASYPFIWNTYQQKQIQWNGIASNNNRVTNQGIETDMGALARNTSEVIGVFAQIETDKRKAAQGYPSSARIQEILDLERVLARLKSPRWPEDILGKIDLGKAERGKAHFDAAHCAGCHQPLAPDDLTTPIKASMHRIDDMQTDIILACNTYFHRSKAGNFAGQEIFPRPFTPPGMTPQVIGTSPKEEDFTRNMLVNTIYGAIIHQLPALQIAKTRSFVPDTGLGGTRGVNPIDLLDDFDADGRVNQEKCINTDDPLLAYKARSLNGIWATAPYLHNGSVPTLYDLLLPSAVSVEGTDQGKPGVATRPEIFGVGSRAFDPRKVGFVTDPALNPTTFRVRDEKTGKPIFGNLNSGHDFGTGLTDEERYELVEYLKTL